MKCYRRLLNISYEDNGTSEDIRRKNQAAIGKLEESLACLEIEIEVVWSHLKVFWHSKDNSIGHSERKKKKR